MDLARAKSFTQHLIATVPDLTHPSVELVAEGDRACNCGRYEGIQTGSYLGLAQTRGRISATGMGLLRIEGDRVAEVWIWPDSMTIMQQLGVIPSMG